MRPRVLGVIRLGLGVFRLGLGLCLVSSFVVACGGDPVVPVDATPDADLTDALDQIPPDTMITVRPAALVNSPLARFEFTSDSREDTIT